MKIIAIDIDLRRICAVGSAPGTTSIYVAEPGIVDAGRGVNSMVKWIRHFDPHVVLIEVASASSYGKPWQRSRVAWALWNIAVAARLASDRNMLAPVLVASSAQWTNGLTEPVRHQLANVNNFGKTKRDKHDLNDCEAMIWSYRTDPSRWSDMATYLNNLT